MKTKFGATVLAAAFLAALVIPWTVLAGGGGGGRGGGGGGKGGGGTGRMGGESIGNQTRMENQIRTRDMEQLHKGDGKGDKDRDRDQDRDRDRIHKDSGTEPAAAATESAVSSTGEKREKGYTYGLRDGTGPDHPEDGTGWGAPANR